MESKTEVYRKNVTSNVPGMIYQFLLRPDGSRAFTYVSEGCQQIYGVTCEEAMADPDLIFGVVHPDDLPSLETAIAESAATMQAWHWSGRIIVDEETRWAEGQSNPTVGPEGIVWNGVVVDITEHMRLQQELEASLTALRHAEEARDGLSRMIVHDMNNPLSALGGFAELLQMQLESDSIDKETFRKFLGFINAGSKQLQSLVQGLLDVSKMEADQLKVSLRPFDLAEMANTTCAAASFQAEHARILLNCTDSADVLAMADSDLMPRILQNLLSNAFKYSGEGSTVAVTTECLDGEVLLKVADSGPGIPVENRERIFDKFFQADLEQGTRRGVGLGLAFCKMAVEAQNGRIWVESEEGVGTTFVIAIKSA